MRSLISALTGLALLASPVIGSAKTLPAQARTTASAQAAAGSKTSMAKPAAKTEARSTKIRKSTGSKSVGKSQGRTIKSRKPHTTSKPSSVRK
jgi:hypothetical protein